MEAKPVNIDAILSQIKKLNYQGKLHVLQQIVSLLKSDTVDPQHPTLSSLDGLGTEIWQDIDIARYVEEERKWD